jgi:glycosyltransferase involved in cell wall biosynthesis
VKICLIGCWYKNDMYSHHLNRLIEFLVKQRDVRLRLITSNCNCFSTAQRYSIAREELLNFQCTVIKTPYAPPEPSKAYGMLKYQITKILRLNYILETLRGIQFYWSSRKCDVLHFDQVLRSFGVLSLITLLLLSRISGRKVIVTVHELDPLQVRYRGLNKWYSWADRLIVFSNGFRDKLISFGFDPDKIKTLPYCAQLEPIMGLQRDQFIFFGGHNLLKGKGFDSLLGALEIVRSRGQELKVVIYTGTGCNGLEKGKQIASDKGLTGLIEWREFLYGKDLVTEYQKSIACLIPYTGGSGRHPATSAMANATPVIATRMADLPEYLGELAIYIKGTPAQELADAMGYLANNPEVVRSMGGELRKRAEEKFSKNVIGKQLLDIYRETYASA